MRVRTGRRAQHSLRYEATLAETLHEGMVIQRLAREFAEADCDDEVARG